MVGSGSSQAGYDGVRADHLGWNMQYQGNTGTAYGSGIYCGLSDHVCVRYNKGFPDGTMILSLLLTNEPLRGYSGSGTMRGCMETFVQSNYTKPSGCKNNHCMVVRDPRLILPIGLAVSCE